MHSRARAFCEGAGLSALTFAVLLAALELAVFPSSLRLLPLRCHGYLPRALRVLAQSSKSGVIPRRYAALLGDSYAEGFGDWFLDADPDRNGPYGSQHVLHQATGWDVIDLGQSGSGSLTGLAGIPLGILDYLGATARYRLPPPAKLIVYFYEGNDLDDNLRDLNVRYDPDWDRGRLRELDYFARFISEVVVGESPLERERAGFHWCDNLMLLRFARNMLLYRWRELRHPTPVVSDVWTDGAVNRALVRGRAVPLPDGLQGPSLELSREEVELGAYVFEQSLRFLVRRFPGTPVAVVYVPAPLSCYPLASRQVSIESYWSRGKTWPVRLVAKRGEAIARLIAAAAGRQGAAFVDTRPALRAAAAGAFVHGPKDWKHFNRRGYEALAAAVAPLLKVEDAVAR